MSRISTRSLQKFMATQKSQFKSRPKLWPQLNDATEMDEQGVRTLTLSHPILHTLESSSPTPKQFNHILTQLLILGIFQHSLAFSRVVMKLCSHSLSRVSYSVNLFGRFNEPDAFICNIITRGFVNFDDPFGGLRFYNEKMVGRFVWPNHYTFPIVLKVCGEMGDVKEGEKGHGRIVKLGFELDLFVRNSLIRMYSVCGRVWDPHKGTISFGIGFFFVIIGWPVVGMILEAYRFIVLFSGFGPTLAVFVQKIPVIGWVFQQPFIRSFFDRYRGKRVPV